MGKKVKILKKERNVMGKNVTGKGEVRKSKMEEGNGGI